MFNHLLKIPVLLIMLISFPGLCRADTEGTVRGMMRMYLYEDGTADARGGVDNIYASLGDTISIEVWIFNVLEDPISQISLYFTVDSNYFDVVKQKVYPSGEFAPFIQREFMKPAVPQVFPVVGNYSAGDKNSPLGNGTAGWQLDYIESAKLILGQELGSSSSKYGTLCSFKLVAKAVCDSATIKLDNNHTNNRFTRYSIKDKNDSYYFQVFRTCYISVSGAEIDPPLEDIVITPGESDTSLDLDDHIELSTIPDALFSWEASGNSEISVSIDPATHVVTFTAPDDYRGYEDITFTVGDAKDSNMDSDTMRVTAGYRPLFDTDALPDTIYIYEDSLQVVLSLPDIVDDPDNSIDTLTWEFASGEKVIPQKSGNVLLLQGVSNLNGDDHLEITVRDDLGLEDSITIPVWIYPVKDKPVLEGLKDVEFERSKSHEFDISEYASDVDGDSLTVTYAPVDSLNIEVNGTIVKITEVVGFLGIRNVMFTVTHSMGLY